jgi:hypothetical protein
MGGSRSGQFFSEYVMLNSMRECDGSDLASGMYSYRLQAPIEPVTRGGIGASGRFHANEETDGLEVRPIPIRQFASHQIPHHQRRGISVSLFVNNFLKKGINQKEGMHAVLEIQMTVLPVSLCNKICSCFCGSFCAQAVWNRVVVRLESVGGWSEIHREGVPITGRCASEGL